MKRSQNQNFELANSLQDAGVRYVLREYSYEVFKFTHPDLLKSVDNALTGVPPSQLGLMHCGAAKRYARSLFLEFDNCNQFQKRQIVDWLIAYLIIDLGYQVFAIDPLDWLGFDSKDLSNEVSSARSYNTAYVFRDLSAGSKLPELLLPFMNQCMEVGIPCIMTGLTKSDTRDDIWSKTGVGDSHIWSDIGVVHV